MEYVRLGQTGLKVSRLCLGCMTYGSSKWRSWVLDEDEALPFFKQALEAGINAVFVPHEHTWQLEHEEVREVDGRLLRVSRFAELRDYF